MNMGLNMYILGFYKANNRRAAATGFATIVLLEVKNGHYFCAEKGHVWLVWCSMPHFSVTGALSRVGRFFLLPSMMLLKSYWWMQDATSEGVEQVDS